MISSEKQNSSRLITAIVVMLVLFACSPSGSGSGDETDTLTSDSLSGVSEDTSIGKPASFIEHKEILSCNKNFIDPACIAPVAYVYLKPDSNSKRIKEITFDTPIVFKVEEGGDCNWFEVSVDGKKGYVRDIDVASHTFTSTADGKDFKYFVVTDFVRRKGDFETNAYIYKYDRIRKQFVDTFIVTDLNFNVIRQLNSVYWKNVDLLLQLSSNIGCCGCSQEEYYLADTRNKFSVIFRGYEYMDDETDENGDIYPGDDYISVTLPLNPGIDTIVYSEYESHPKRNKRGKTQKDSTGEYIMDVKKDINRYYHWNDSGLVELKTQPNL